MHAFRIAVIVIVYFPFLQRLHFYCRVYAYVFRICGCNDFNVIPGNGQRRRSFHHTAKNGV